MEHIAILVPGQLWESPLIARTCHSLALEGLQCKTFEYTFGSETSSLTRKGALERLLLEAGDQPALVLPAGSIVQAGFGQRFIELSPIESRVSQNFIPDGHHPFFVKKHEAEGGVLSYASLSDELGRFIKYILAPGQEQNRPSPLFFLRGRYLRRSEGENLYQALKSFPSPERLEPKVALFNPETLQTVGEGWVYRCNNEPLDVDISSAYLCETLVAVGAGIKPWHLANQMRHRLKHMIVIDSHLPQLAFASRARALIATSTSWSEICDSLPFRSTDDRHLRAAHNRLFGELQQHEHEWRFSCEYVHVNLLTQTFRLIETLRKMNIEKPLFWYSNIFQPYLAPGVSEHNAGLEYSFLSLMREVFPGSVFFSAGTMPVSDPRKHTIYPGIGFRLRRLIEERLQLRLF